MVGTSTIPGCSYLFGKFLSLANVDIEHAEVGSALKSAGPVARARRQQSVRLLSNLDRESYLRVIVPLNLNPADAFAMSPVTVPLPLAPLNLPVPDVTL